MCIEWRASVDQPIDVATEASEAIAEACFVIYRGESFWRAHELGGA
jgi:hypothetical protein